jgi:hypothetical protein
MAKKGLIHLDMYNWSMITTILKKNPEKYQVWRLEQLINFGLGNEKLNALELRKYWNRLNLDPKRKNVLEFWMR